MRPPLFDLDHLQERPFPAALGVLLLVIFLYIGFVYKAPAIETEVSERAAAALENVAGEAVEIGVDGRSVTLSGFVASEEEKAQALAAIEATPGALGPIDRLEIRAFAEPYRFEATFGDDGAISAESLAPNQAAALAIRTVVRQFAKERGAGAPDLDLDLALGAPNTLWTEAIDTGLDGLAQLETGTLIIEDTAIMLVGAAFGDTDRAALRASAEAAGALGYSWREDIAWPFRLDAEKSENSAWTVETMAADAAEKDEIAIALRQTIGDEATLTVEQVNGDPPEAWADIVINATRALAVLESGRVAILDGVGEIEGIAASDAARREAEALTSTSAAVKWRRAISVVAPPPTETAQPASLTLELAPDAPVALSGRLPEGMTAAEATRLLGVDIFTGEPSSDGVGDLELWRDDLAALGELLPEFDAAIITVGEDLVAIEGDVHRASDVDQVARLLTTTFDEARRPAFDIGPTASDYEDGARRSNPLTGAEEVFRNGYWLPVISIADDAACVAEAARLSAEGGVRFLTDSDALDVRARSALNALATVAHACLAEDGARLEIGGHTDSTGDPEYNLDLSKRRAEAVAAALEARGLDPARLEPKGFGAAQPIADNDTPEGRAANRRITFEWKDS